MLDLYFGSISAIISTVLVISILGYIGFVFYKKEKIRGFGKHIAVILFWGLLVCIFVATRDDYVLSVANAFNAGKIGTFSLSSIQSNLCCLAGGVIAISAISSIFVKNQKYRKTVFFVISGAVIFKTLVIEISRLLLI